MGEACSRHDAFLLAAMHDLLARNPAVFAQVERARHGSIMARSLLL
jgi:hypothetical protein